MDTTTIFVSVGGWLITLVIAFAEMRSQQRKFDIDQNKRMEEINNLHEKHLIELKAANEKQLVELKACQERQMIDVQASVNQSIAILDCKIDELARRVEKHNNVVERTYKLESDMKLVEEKIKNLGGV